MIAYTNGTGKLIVLGEGADDVVTLERMAAADGDYSQIEHDCIAALAKNSL